ncbi:hypothetical protein [Desulforhopalus sp. IMCC35007]|uniref:hypothetical protein n=1 Tax=Desulforhopalus sp. IMCC35007 TaxID=2569543 RepID=UPI0010AEE901|nr:hypothetical protein [Desulforhopalus sp. IMCC35007]TKB10884.1 hypothetical protein FCL48_06585 [Desulforhopalus sp. IMCC35007]
MKSINNKRIALTILSLFSVIFFFGNNVMASSHEAAQKEISEAVAAIKDYTIEERDEAIAKAQELLDKFDDNKHVWEGRMKEKLDNLKDSSKDNYEASKKSLEEQRKELSMWKEKMQNSSSEAWDEIKTGFEGAYDSLVEDWKKAEQGVEDDM